jgi:hypothetical protein
VITRFWWSAVAFCFGAADNSGACRIPKTRKCLFLCALSACFLSKHRLPHQVGPVIALSCVVWNSTCSI